GVRNAGRPARRRCPGGQAPDGPGVPQPHAARTAPQRRPGPPRGLPFPRPMKRLLVLLLAGAALLALPGAAIARCPKTSLAEVEAEVMCPQCGIPLELATEAPQAQAERRFIQEQVEACRSKEEII